jgi:hypothetical protein
MSGPTIRNFAPLPSLFLKIAPQHMQSVSILDSMKIRGLL